MQFEIAITRKLSGCLKLEILQLLFDCFDVFQTIHEDRDSRTKLEHVLSRVVTIFNTSN